jgi:hypothetical protein
LLELLLDLGLPHQGRGADRCFDKVDLDNIELALGLPGLRWTALKWCADSLRPYRSPAVLTHRLTVRAECTGRDENHRCDFRLVPQILAASDPGSVSRQSTGRLSFRLTTKSLDHLFDGPVRAVIEQMRSVEFHLLPGNMEDDPAFVRANGLADCRLGSTYIVHLARAAGVEARPATGIFLVKPYAVRHTWVEFRVDQGWIAADPLLLNAFARWGMLDRTEWPAHRSPHGALCPLAADWCGVPVMHNGVPVEAMLAHRT